MPGRYSFDTDFERGEYIGQVTRAQEERLTQERALALHLPYVNLRTSPIDLDSLILIPEQESRRAKLAIIQNTGKKLHVGVFDPRLLETKKTIDSLHAQGYIFNVMVVSESSLNKAWEFYTLYKAPQFAVEGIFHISRDAWEKFSRKAHSIQEVGSEIERLTTSTSELMAAVFIGSFKAKSSDIHLDAYDTHTTLRYRVDGVLHDIAQLDPIVYHYVVSRIKILAGLKLNLHNTNQDGRFTVRIEDVKDVPKSNIDVRVSILPSGHGGETIVMRLLGVSVVDLILKEMGMHPEQLRRIKAALDKPNGLILTTGPTGSGKTTTLYSALNEINSPEINIITIENPIEYQIPGITQTQVNDREGYTFEQGLSAIVRQDPDVILVGEIRSTDSANMAINAALTGHLVLSTLHTNDAAGAVPRLRNLNVQRSLIPASLSLIIAQRLVRELCPKCKQEYDVSVDMKEAMVKALALVSPRAKVTPPENFTKAWKAVGCEDCFGTGYKGQTGIFEMFPMDDMIERLILEDATSYDIRKTAMEQGMVTLLQHGLLKVLDGTTSLEEIQRVAGDARYIEELYGKAVLALLSSTLRIPKDIIAALTKDNLRKSFIEQRLAEADLDELLHWSMAAAKLMDASDIHFEPGKDNFEVRFRVDGVLQPIAEVPKKLYLPLIAEVKELSGLKVGTYSEIQEGRFAVELGDATFDIRTSVIPGGYGETAVLRLLNPNIESLKLETLGMHPKILAQLMKELRKPNGMLLNTGPTGAGKTTTLYALLNMLNTGSEKIITIENPIEYKLAGIMQTQVNPDSGYTFSTALRSLLRQDPDIMMVGEIRDYDTAQTAIQAALTGHLIFSTVHTNDALGTIKRMDNLGISDQDISASLNVIMAQRLVRRLCPECKQLDDSVTDELKQKINEEIERSPNSYVAQELRGQPIAIYKPGPVCEICNEQGYKGRIAIYEILFVDEEVRRLIATSAPLDEIKKYAVEKLGFVSLKQDGIYRLLKGVTSVDEVDRAVGLV